MILFNGELLSDEVVLILLLGDGFMYGVGVFMMMCVMVGCVEFWWEYVECLLGDVCVIGL